MPPWIQPPRIRLGASTTCQLHCPLCPTTRGEVRKGIGTGFLKFEDFRGLVDENPWVLDIELSTWGEPFLNPDLSAIVEYAHRKGVSLSAGNGSNFNDVPQTVLEALVRCEFWSITCALDGACQKTHSRYRAGGDFDRVIGNIRRLNSLKAARGTPFPLLKWQFVALGDNEGEIPAARELARELGMEFFVKLSWEPGAEGRAAAQAAGPVTVYDTDLILRRICTQLWRQPQINFDGRLLGCCSNFWADLGDAFTEGLVESLNGERIGYARRMLMGQAPPRADIPCASCPTYREAAEGKARWITPAETVWPGSFASAAFRGASWLKTAHPGAFRRLRREAYFAWRRLRPSPSAIVRSDGR
ncbi:MAG: hypothetical protein A2X36_13465 [Elusimicrobia bacterium GWA2_69_24]|nr:MAG: hypothetical protein A2X36_13465 [Elusimicrobia bacterium GWA2_69_24]HBL15825.1 radical SAM protein [Elusimicrobiota bacterium]